jgi:hypothetical protein
MDITRRKLFSTGLAAVVSSVPLASAGTSSTESIPVIPGDGPGVYTPQSLVDQTAALMELIPVNTPMSWVDTESLFALSRSILAQAQVATLRGHITSSSHVVLAHAVTGYIPPSIPIDLSDQFDGEPSDPVTTADLGEYAAPAFDFTLPTYAELVQREYEIVAMVPHQSPQFKLFAKLLSVVLGLDLTSELLDFLFEEFKSYIRKIHRILTGASPYNNLNRAQRIQRALGVFQKLWNKLTSRAFFNRLANVIGRTAAQKFIGKMIAKAVPGLGIAVLAASIIGAISNQSASVSAQ